MKLIPSIVIVEHVLVCIVPSFSETVNSTLSVNTAKPPLCITGKQRYDFVKRRCRRCPQKCRRSPEYRSYNITVSPLYGALECYPCICKKGKKFYDEKTKRCKRCPSCNANSIIINDNVTVDKWFGALDCYSCTCKKGFYANHLTHDQCVGCRNCQQDNKKVHIPCSQDRDAECGDCVDGYKYTEFGRCLKINSGGKSTTATTEAQMNANDTGLSGPSIKPPQKSVNHGSTIQRSYVIIVVILIMVFMILGVAVYFVFRKKCCPGITDVTFLSSQSTVTSITKPAEDLNGSEPVLLSVSNPLISKGHEQKQNTEQNTNKENIQRDDGTSNFSTECLQINAENVIFQIGDKNTVCQRLLSSEAS